MKILLTEGSDDKRFVANLFRRNQVDFGENFEIRQCNGIGKLFRNLKLALLSENYERIGLIIDADTELEEYWRQIGKYFRQVRHRSLPRKPHPKGTIIEALNALPRVGIWVMPDNKTEGSLEDFVSQLVPDDDLLWPLAEHIIEDLERAGRCLFKAEHRNKAVLHTWLAWQEKPGLSPAQALNYRFADSGEHLLPTDEARMFLHWAERTFS